MQQFYSWRSSTPLPHISHSFFPDKQADFVRLWQLHFPQRCLFLLPQKFIQKGKQKFNNLARTSHQKSSCRMSSPGTNKPQLCCTGKGKLTQPGHGGFTADMLHWWFVYALWKGWTCCAGKSSCHHGNVTWASWAHCVCTALQTFSYLSLWFSRRNMGLFHFFLSLSQHVKLKNVIYLSQIF